MIKSHQGQFSKTESTHQHTEHNQPLTRKNYIKTMPKSKVMIFIAIKIRLMLRMKHKDEEAMVRNKLNKLINHYPLRMQMKIFTVNVNSKTSLKQNEPKVSFKVNKWIIWCIVIKIMARIMELKHNQKPIKFKQVSSSQLLIPKRKFGKLSQCKDGSNQKIKDSLYNDFELFRRKK